MYQLSWLVRAQFLKQGRQAERQRKVYSSLPICQRSSAHLPHFLCHIPHHTASETQIRGKGQRQDCYHCPPSCRCCSQDGRVDEYQPTATKRKEAHLLPQFVPSPPPACLGEPSQAACQPISVATSCLPAHPLYWFIHSSPLPAWGVGINLLVSW